MLSSIAVLKMPTKLKPPFLQQHDRNFLLDLLAKPSIYGIATAVASSTLSDALYDYLDVQVCGPVTFNALLAAAGFTFGCAIVKGFYYARSKALQQLLKYQGWIVDHTSTKTKVYRVEYIMVDSCINLAIVL